METINIDTCNDIRTLKAYARELESENRRLKSAYMLLSSRMSQVMPLLKEELANCNWDSSASDCIKLTESGADETKQSKIEVDRGCFQLLDTMRIPRTNIYCCSYNSSGKFLACGCFNGCVIIYKYSNSSNRLRHIRSLTGHTGLVTSVMWIKGDDRIVTTSIDKTIRVWKPMTGEFETLIKTDIMVLSACLFSAGDHDICAAAGSQNRLLLADIQLSRVVRLLEHKSQITAVVEYKQYIITGDTEGEIIVINNSTYDCVNRLSRPQYQVQSLKIHKTVDDDYYLSVVYSNNIIEVFLMSGVDFSPMCSYQIPELKMVHPNCTMIEDPSISLSSVLPSDHCIEEIEEKVVPQLYLLAGGMTGKAYIWPIYKQKMSMKPRTMKIYDNAIYCVDFSNDSKLLATCSEDHSLTLWKSI
ncbi:hypothetical protein WA538_005458 [Blastocystis sp. DL]